MAADADSPMHKDLYDRIQSIAREDNEREERLGRSLPSRLTIFLVGGHEIPVCHLIDGENSLDDQSIDVVTPEDGRSANWIVPLSAIAAIHHTYPDEAASAAEGDANDEPAAIGNDKSYAFRALVAALKPFARFYVRGAPGDHVITQGSAMAKRQLTMGDCGRAHDVLVAIGEPIDG
jgi:hypothetical protein